MKLFNLMKGIFGKPTHAPEVEEAVAYEGMPAEAVPAQDFATEIISRPQATPAPAPAAPKVDLDSSEMVLPLSSIVASFPVELQQRIKTELVGQINVAFPLEAVMSQLAQGQVRVRFGDIRNAAPHAFTSGSDRDAVAVTLPLGELVSRLQPAMLGRRAARQVEVPDEVASPFAGGGQGLSMGNRPAARTPDTSILSRPRAAQAARSVPPLADPRARGNVTSFRKPATPGGSSITPKSPLPLPSRPVTPAARPIPPASLAATHKPLPPIKPGVSKPVVGGPSGENPFSRPAAVPGNGSHSNFGMPAKAPASKPSDSSPLWISFNLITEARSPSRGSNCAAGSSPRH